MAKHIQPRYGDKLEELVPMDIDVEAKFGISIDPEKRRLLTWQDLVEWQDIQSASRGSPKSIQSTTDRAFGKVTQVVENLNVNMNYTDFLDQLPPPDEGGLVIDVTPTKEIEEDKDPLAEFL